MTAISQTGFLLANPPNPNPNPQEAPAFFAIVREKRA